MNARLRCLACIHVHRIQETPNSRYAVPLVFEGAFSVAAISLVGGFLYELLERF